MIEFIELNMISVIFAFMLDKLFGEPNSKYHPICMIGRLISKLERIFYKSPDHILSGSYLLITIVLIVSIITYSLLVFAHSFGNVAYIMMNSVIIYFSISVRSMASHADAVYQPLVKGDLETARKALSMIVSRQTKDMDEMKIVRSTVESVSENFTDGVLSPIFYSIFFGGVGAMFFKAVSTLDSMIGYMNGTYDLFGRASAKFDDVLNFIPARLSVFIIAFSGIMQGTAYAETIATVKKYRLAHPSPNSAHSISAFAGFLGVRLGGPVCYFGKVKQKPFIGDGENPLDADVIKKAVSLYDLASMVAVVILCGLTLLAVM
ncbi:MAG: adenosylcobinamide-phosphate synthase CbiB [Deferribacterales bacterium]